MQLCTCVFTSVSNGVLVSCLDVDAFPIEMLVGQGQKLGLLVIWCIQCSLLLIWKIKDFKSRLLFGVPCLLSLVCSLAAHAKLIKQLTPSKCIVMIQRA